MGDEGGTITREALCEISDDNEIGHPSFGGSGMLGVLAWGSSTHMHKANVSHGLQVAGHASHMDSGRQRQQQGA